MIRILISGIVAGAIFFFWGFLVHAVIQLHSGTIHTVPNEEAIRTAVNAAIPRTGVYFVPAFPHEKGMTEEERESAMETFLERHEAGPIGLLFVRKEGARAMHPMHFAGGFIIFVLTGLVASLLLHAAAPALPGYFGRWMFVVGIGVTAIIFGDVSFWNWWPVPLEYTALMVVDHLIGWALAGAAIAAIVTRGSVRWT